jgi:hypothetical protein
LAASSQEREHAMRRRHADHGRIAVDDRLVGAGRPIHHHLRLGQEQRVGAVESRPQNRDLVMRGRFQPRRPRPRPQQQDRGDDREYQQSDQQHQHRGLVAVDTARSAEHQLVQHHARRFGVSRKRRKDADG